MFTELAWLYPAIVACILASVASSVAGGYVMARRINNAASGIAHILLGGAGIALYFDWPLMVGSLMVALVGAMIIGILSERYPQQEDVIINALWSSSMAVGIILLSLSDRANLDYAGYLFGNVLLANATDLWLLAVVNLLLLGAVWAFRRAFLAVAFDRDFAQSRGVPVVFINHLLLVLVALVVVAVVRVVGIVFVVALLTLPLAIASRLTATLKGWILSAIVINLAACALGIYLAYRFDLPIGASVIALLGLGFLTIFLAPISFSRQ